MAVVPQRRAAYFAGYFDADGCVSVSINGDTLSIKVSVSGRNPQITGALEVLFGGSSRTRDDGVSVWNAYSQNALAFMNNIYTYVEFKKKQVDMAIKVLDTNLNHATRLFAALHICKYNQENMATPKLTKTMEQILAVLVAGGHEPEMYWSDGTPIWEA
jgi:intein/homing endonuclease